MIGKTVVDAVSTENKRYRHFTVCGQPARVLIVLVEVGRGGVTTMDVLPWGYRLAAHCHVLRHQHGLNIRTVREEHPGGWHGRYVLESYVEITDVEFVETAE